MASVPDPFTPRTPVDRAMLEDYLQGRLNPKERHVVELHMEDDPFLRDELEADGVCHVSSYFPARSRSALATASSMVPTM